jgi:hypothetical protein
MVEAISFFFDPESSTRYGFANDGSEKIKHAPVQEIFQRMCIDFTEKGYKFGEADYTSFFELCLQPLIDSHDAKWFSIATLISTGFDPKKGFKEIKPKSVWDLGMRASREFHALSKSFDKLLDTGKKVPTGEQWRRLMERFRNALFHARAKSDEDDSDLSGDEEDVDAQDSILDVSSLDFERKNDNNDNAEDGAPFKFFAGEGSCLATLL